MSDAPLDWYFDFISPFAYLQWRRLRTLPAGAGIEPVPILLGAVLEALGQRGPAEIPRKREATYRLVAWQARREGVTLRFPPAHPFNPLAALRLCIAAGTTPAATAGATRRANPTPPIAAAATILLPALALKAAKSGTSIARASSGRSPASTPIEALAECTSANAATTAT